MHPWMRIRSFHQTGEPISKVCCCSSGENYTRSEA